MDVYRNQPASASLLFTPRLHLLPPLNLQEDTSNYRHTHPADARGALSPLGLDQAGLRCSDRFREWLRRRGEDRVGG